MGVLQGAWKLNPTKAAFPSMPTETVQQEYTLGDFLIKRPNQEVRVGKGFFWHYNSKHDEYSFGYMHGNDSSSITIYKANAASSATPASWNTDKETVYDVGDGVTVSDTFYDWFVANAIRTGVVSFDLSTLALLGGVHTITVKARGAGYISSPASEAVEYTA